MAEREPPTPLRDLDERLKRLRAEEAGEDRSAAKARERSSGLGFALRIGVELVAALGVGVGIGLLLDRWLGTTPWLLIVFFVLGAAAGMMNVYRVMSGMDQSVGYAAGKRRRRKDEGTKTEDAEDRGRR